MKSPFECLGISWTNDVTDTFSFSLSLSTHAKRILQVLARIVVDTLKSIICKRYRAVRNSVK